MSTETTEPRDIIRAKEPTQPLEDFVIEDPYARWLEREGVRVMVDFAFDDLNTLELGPWERKGGSGAVINIPNYSLLNDACVVEIDPGGSSEPDHHMYEAMFYILSGRGATSLWVDGGRKRTFEWHRGSLFAIPLNAHYQHFNASGDEAVRYVSVTNAPPMMRLFNNDDFIWNNPYVFGDRYSDEDDYFSGTGKLYNRRIWESNFIPNAATMPLYDWSARGAGGINAMLEMAGNNMKAHISEFPVGTYKKAHRHGPGAHLLLLSGDAGYSLLWQKDDMSDLRKADWREGSMVIVPGEATYHQHFNSGSRRARYLALRHGNHGLEAPFAGAPPHGGDVSFKEGGHQVEYEDEARRIHEIFENELDQHDATCRMKAFIPWCTGEVGPTRERDT